MFEKEAEKYCIHQKLLEDVRDNICKAFEDGATFGYQKGVQKLDKKWHDLRKNPKDLPEPHSTVLDENVDKIEYIGYDKWEVYSEYYERYIEVDPPIAWCEVPTFKE